MSDRIIYVHGRSHKPAADALTDLWDQALASAVAREENGAEVQFAETARQMVYFADISQRALGNANDYDEARDLADRQHALRELTARKKKHFVGRRVYEETPGSTPLAEFFANTGLPLAHLLGLSERIFARVAPDLAQYWRDEAGFGREARDRLADVLRAAWAAGERVLLVTHSLGSVIAYDTLWELSHDRRSEGLVSNWLTLGSPLGDETVKSRLKGASEPTDARYPTNVVEWVNVAAADDYFCHDKQIHNDFRGMLAARAISRIRDFRVFNLTVRFGKSNPHSSLGYLCHPRVGALVGDWLATSAARSAAVDLGSEDGERESKKKRKGKDKEKKSDKAQDDD